MYYVVTLAVFALGVWMLVSATRLRKELARYEFNNTTAGGVVQFDNFDDAERHRKRHERVGTLVNIGMLLALVGGLGLLGGVAVLLI